MCKLLHCDTCIVIFYFGQASINTLLNRVGISAKPINSFEELRKSASSMFVAIFEAMFQVRQNEACTCACRNIRDVVAWWVVLGPDEFPHLSACLCAQIFASKKTSLCEIVLLYTTTSLCTSSREEIVCVAVSSSKTRASAFRHVGVDVFR